MSSENFVIQRLVFDIDCSSEPGARQLQDTVSQLFRSSLSGQMESFFDKRISKAFLAKVDRLELDLGDIPYHSFAEQLPVKLLAALEEAFPRAEDAVNSGDANIRLIPLAAGNLELLSHFLLHGTFPATAGRQSISSLEDLLADLTRDHAPELQEMLRQLGANQNVIKRIAFQLSDASIRSIIRLLEPSEAAFILQYHREMAQLQKEEQPLPAPVSSLERELWAFILDFMLHTGSSEFSRTAFARSNIRQIAAHYSLDYTALLTLLYTTIQQKHFTRYRGEVLLRTVEELAGDDLPDAVRLGGSNLSNAKEPIQDDWEVITTFFTHGSLGGSDALFSANEIAELLLRLLRERKKATLAILRSAKTGAWQVLLKAIAHPVAFIGQLLELLRQGDFDGPVPDISNTANDVHGLAELIMQATGDRPQITQPTSLDAHAPDWPEQALSYFISYGALPWWIAVSSDTTPATMLSQLFASAPQRTYLLIERSARVNRYRTRLLQQFPAIQLLDIMLQGGPGQAARQLFDQLQRTMHKAAGVSEDVLARLVLLAVWDGPHSLAIRYEGDSLFAFRLLQQALAFNEPGLASLVIEVLPYEADRVLASEIIARHRVPPAITANTPPGITDAQEPPVDIIGVADKKTDTVHAPIHLPPSLADYAATGVFAYHPDAARTVKEIVRYFLIWGRLPVVGSLDEKTRIVLLRDAGLFLFHHHREALSALLTSTICQPEAVLVFTGLFRVSAGGDEKLLADFLLPAHASALRQHLLARPPANVIDKYAEGRGTKTLEKERAAESRFPSPEQALQALAHFLEKNAWPSRYVYATDPILFQNLLRYLYRTQPAELAALLAVGTHHPAARMQMHLWMDVTHPAGAPPHSLSALAARYAEDDVRLYLLSAGNGHTNARDRQSLADVLLSLTSGALASLLKPLLASGNMAGTLLKHLDKDQFNTLLTHTGPSSARLLQPVLHELKSWLKGFTLTQPEQETLLTSLKAYLLTAAFAQRQMSTELFAQGLIKHIYHLHPALFNRLAAQLQQPESRLADVQPLSVASYAIGAVAALSGGRAGTEAALIENKQRQPEQAIVRPLPELAPKQLPPEDYVPKPFPDGLVDKYAVGNAGLVLLHPFISTLFAKARLQEGGEFCNEDCRTRAVHLLQYLAAGTTTHEEHLLVLNKLLCGMPFDQPVPLSFEPTEEETAIMADLYGALFYHWEKMRNSTIDGFRGSFMLRNGLLARTDEQWILKVEQRAYDILLTTIPWGYGLVKTPWMKKMLTIEWA